MNISKRLTMTTALALTLSLGLAACGEDEPTVEAPADEPAASAPVETGEDETSDEETGADDSGTSSDSGTDDATSDDATGDDTTGATGGDAAGDLTAIALTAIGTAEEEAGGTAYEIDDQDDDGTWEVDVRVGDRSVEVTVSEDGTEVVATEEDDLDEDDRAGLDAATITLGEAIELAVQDAGGVLDDAELESENGTHRWEISLDTEGEDDLEVLVSVTGEVLGTDG